MDRQQLQQDSNEAFISQGLIQSSSYPNVTHKKTKGTLILTEDALTFYPSSSSSCTSGSEATTTAPAMEKETVERVPPSIGTGSSSLDDKRKVRHSWMAIGKHQVSPASHPRHLLKILWKIPSVGSGSGSGSGSSSGGFATFQFSSRLELERIRKDVSDRLMVARKLHALNTRSSGTVSSSTTSTSIGGIQQSVHPSVQQQQQQQQQSRKRKLQDITMQGNAGMSPNKPLLAETTSGSSSSSSSSATIPKASSSSSSSLWTCSSQKFTTLLPSEFCVTCSSILASDRNVRTQHLLLTCPVDESEHDATGGTGTNTTTGLLQEQDFWSTHSTKVSHQSAKILGCLSQGIPSAMKSSLDIQLTSHHHQSVSKPIKLGVEEMRQIFIMYPTVHEAYEEKVPLELSEEQFWRKYLESEYFHRDRGRIGCSAKPVEIGGNGQQQQQQQQLQMQQQESSARDGSSQSQQGGELETGGGGGGGVEKKTMLQEEVETKKAAKEREESARLGAASSNDIFSRKEMELKRKKELGMKNPSQQSQSQQLQSQQPQKLAVGQFDLMATAHTERGSKLLLGSTNDLHPFDDRGKKVIEKYNRHWVMVLNPNDASAGCDLKALAKKSVQYALENDDDAKVHGGFGKEMQRLVGFASADDDHVDHVKGIGRKRLNQRHNNDDDDDEDENEYDSEEPVLFEELNLRNVNVYSGNSQSATCNGKKNDPKDAMLAQFAIDPIKALIAPILETKQGSSQHPSMTSHMHHDNYHHVRNAFPDPKFGRDLLMALTKHMVLDSMNDKDTAKMTKSLPQEFRKRLTSYTRRANELLRHFFALRHVILQEKKRNSQNETTAATTTTTTILSQYSHKLKRIVQGLEDVYREMESMRKDLPQTDLGEKMRKMCLPIMDQLDWAFKLNHDSSGSGGGFVTVND